MTCSGIAGRLLSRMPTRLLLIGLLAAAAGCGRKAATPTPEAATATDTNTPPAAVTEGSTAVRPSPNDDQAQLAAVLAELTQVVRKYSVEQRQVPKSFDELVAAGYLARVPQAPTGKHFAINKNLQVYLADR
jgi:hypothetical protein